MHDFCYVSKKEAAPVKAELLDIIHEVQDIVRDDFTFQFTFIGSSSRNMITYDRKSNIGFDFDINIEVNDDDENYEPKEIRTIIRKALDMNSSSVSWIGSQVKSRSISMTFAKPSMPLPFPRSDRNTISRSP